LRYNIRKNALQFIKPYIKYRRENISLDKAKSEIYSEINRNYTTKYKEKNIMIEYFTEYGDQFEEKKNDKIRKNRKNSEVMKQKLKNQYKRIEL
jgi:hypothetical protein